MSVTLQKRGGAGGASGGFYRLDCDPAVSVGDYVYIRSDGVLDKARANNINTMPAIGKVINKINANECYVSSKLIDEDYTGVTVQDGMFISSDVAGSLVANPPSDPNSVLQQVGIGLSSEKVLIDIDPTNITIKR